jgi:hypothetical protein
MQPQSMLAVCAVAAALTAPAASAGPTPAETCALKAQGVYGFQCQGTTSTGGAAEPVTFIGTVEGRYDAFYEGYGTFNSSQGSAPTHVAGFATFGANCMGRVAYTTNEILLPGGGTVSLPPLVIDFVPVNNFDEILGMPVAGPGVNGDAVPRMVCRLVRIGK